MLSSLKCSGWLSEGILFYVNQGVFINLITYQTRNVSCNPVVRPRLSGHIWYCGQKSRASFVRVWLRPRHEDANGFCRIWEKMISKYWLQILRIIPQNCIAHPYCARFSRHQRALARRVHIHNIYKMVAFSKRLGLLETNPRDFSETSTGT